MTIEKNLERDKVPSLYFRTKLSYSRAESYYRAKPSSTKSI